MRAVAILNFKGGTGKTTTAVNLAHALTFQGRSVLLIDCDPQGSLSGWLGIKSAKTLTHLMLGQASVDSCIVSVRERLDIVPSDEALGQVEVLLAKNNEMETLLRERLSKFSGYDFVFLDCPPSSSLLNRNALKYAREVFLPASMDYLSLQGVKQVLARVPSDVQITKVIPTFFNQQTKKSREILSDLHTVFGPRVTSPIRVNVRLAEAASFHKTIFEYDITSRGACDYWQLAKEILGVQETNRGDTRGSAGPKP